MIKITNVIKPSGEQWLAAIRGARNSMNSWNKMDSILVGGVRAIQFGDNDCALMKKLASENESARKFIRMLPIWMDIEAPMYWWKQFDTYKVGTVRSSTSTMHKLTYKPFDISDFSIDNGVPIAKEHIENTIRELNKLRDIYIDGGSEDKKLWNSMIYILPESYNQKSTVFLNYEVCKKYTKNEEIINLLNGEISAMSLRIFRYLIF